MDAEVNLSRAAERSGDERHYGKGAWWKKTEGEMSPHHKILLNSWDKLHLLDHALY